MAQERPLYTLYKNLKAQNYDVPDNYDRFENALTLQGEAGASNRHKIYDSLKSQNFDVPDSYERFYSALFTPVSKTSSRAKGGNVPLSDADKRMFLNNSKAIVNDAVSRLKDSKRYQELRQRQEKGKKDFGRVDLGASKNIFGGNNANVVQDGIGGDYLTSDGGRTSNKVEAQARQRVLDEQAKDYTEAVDKGAIPSVFDVRDKDGNYDLQENIGKDGTYLTKEGAENQLDRKLADAYARKKELEQALYDNMDKYGGFALLGDKNSNERLDERLKLTSALDLVKDEIGSLEAVKDSGNSWYGDMGKALSNSVFRANSWDFGLSDFNLMAQMERINTKMKNGIPLSGVEKSLLQSKAGADASAALEDEKLGRLYRWTKIAGQSLPFMLDFYLTGGYSGITKAASKGALKYAAKKGMGKVGAAILKNTGVVAADIAGSYAMAGTEQALKTGAAIMQRHMGQLYQDENGNYKFGTFDENGNLLHEGGESIGKALYKGFTAAMLENYTEKIFGHNYGIKKGLVSGLEKMGMKRTANFFKSIGKNAWYAGAKKNMKKFGIDGFFEEVMEEEINIPLNALLVGDNKMSDLADKKQQLDIVGGMALSVGGMYAINASVKGAYNIAQYYRFKNLVGDADTTARNAFGTGDDGTSKWDSIREQIDNTTNDKMGAVLYKILESDDTMSKEQIDSAIDYGIKLMKLRGYNLAKTAELNAKRTTGEQDTPEEKRQQEVENAYSEGHEADDSVKHDYQLEQNDKANALAAKLGITPEKLHDMSDEQLESMTGQSDELDQAIYEYQDSTARYQGVLDAANDKVDLAAQQAAWQVDQMTDLSRGTVRNATVKGTNGASDYGVYIISGNIATHDDGSIDIANSDKMIVYFDPTTGRKETAEPLMFSSVGEENVAEEVKEMAVTQAKEQAIKEIAGIIDGTVGVGSAFSATDEQGNETQYEILADNGDGSAMITIDGNVDPNPHAFEELQQLKDAEDLKRLEVAKQQRAEMEAQREGVSQTEQEVQESPVEAEEPSALQNIDLGKVVNADGNIVRAEVTDNRGEDMYPDAVGVFLVDDKGAFARLVVADEDGNLTTVVAKKKNVKVIDSVPLEEYRSQIVPDSTVVEEESGANAHEAEEVKDNIPPTTEESHSESPKFEDGTEIPVDKDGEVDFSQTDAEHAAEWYDNNLGDDAESTLSEYVKQAKAALSRAKEKKVKGNKPSELVASKKEKEAAISDAQAKYDSAVSIRDAYNERRIAKQLDSHDGRMGLLQKAKNKFARLKNSEEWKNNAQALWNDTIGSILHRMYDGVSVNVFDHTPQTLEEYVSSSISPYSLNYEGTDESKGVKQETGLERKDFAKSHVLAAEGKGTTIDKFVHKLWDNRPSQFENATDQDIRNALLSLITSDMNAYDMQHVIENNRIAQAEKEIEDEKLAGENTAIEENVTDETPSEEQEVTTATEEETPTDAPSDAEVPEDSTSEKPLGEQLDESEVPFSQKKGAVAESKEEREKNIEDNRVENMKTVDNIIGKKTRKAFERIAKMMGSKIQFQYSDKIANGWYDPEKNTIYLSLSSAMTDGAQFIFGHEMTHEIKNLNPSAYEELRNLVKDSFTDEAYAQFVNDMRNRYADTARIIGREDLAEKFLNEADDYFEEEFVADNIGKMIDDANYAQTLASRMSHPLLSALHDILLKIKRALLGTEYEDGTKMMLRGIEQAYVKTMNRDAAEVSTATGEQGNRMSIRKKPAPKNTIKVYKLMRLNLEDNTLNPLFIDAKSPTKLHTWYDADSPNLGQLRSLPSGVHIVNNETGETMSFGDWYNEHTDLYTKENGKVAKMGKFPSKEALQWATDNNSRFICIEDTKNGQKRFDGENRKYWNLGINGSGSVSTFSMRPGWHAGSLPTMRQIGKGKNKNLRDDNFVWVEGEISADVDYNDEAQKNPDKDIPNRIPEDGYYLKATNANKAASQADRVGWYVAGSFKANRIMSDSECRKVIDDWNTAHPDLPVEYDYERESGKMFNANTMRLEDKDGKSYPRFSLKVYHGSQASFDHFDHSFMGSGEGAQAYGWGTYVSEVEGIAKAYARNNAKKNAPSRLMYQGKPMTYQTPTVIYQVALDMDKNNISAKEAISKMTDAAEKKLANIGDTPFEKAKAKQVKSELETLKGLNPSDFKINEDYDTVAQNLADVKPGLSFAEEELKDANSSVNLYLSRLNEAKEELEKAKASDTGLGVDMYEEDVEYYNRQVEYYKRKAKTEEEDVKDIKAEVDALQKKLDSMEKPRNLYNVEIPDDTGDNYIDWDGSLSENAANNIAKGIVVKDIDAAIDMLGKYGNFIVHDEVKRLHDRKDEIKKDKLTERLSKAMSGFRGGAVYDDLAEVLGGRKAASLFLKDTGFDGVKVIAQRNAGGNKDGRMNYVIFDESNAKIVNHERFSLKEINNKFNKRLDELVKNPNQKDKILRLGRASSFLKKGGIPDAEIELEFDKLKRKSKEGYAHEHPFDLEDAKDLPLAIAKPIAVFNNTNGRNDAKVILTELKKEDRNFIVAIQTINQNRKGGAVLQVNQIVTLFPKAARGVVNWFNIGKATNIDKEKALRFIEALPNHSGTTITSEELDSAANIIRNFETSKGNGKKISSENDNIRFSLAGLSGAATADKAEGVITRLQNFNIALQMEKEKKDAKAVKMATGWERGADGKWRYEMPDAKMPEYIDIDGKKAKRHEEDILWTFGKLGDVVNAPELFKAYPQLKDVVLDSDSMTGDFPSNGSYDPNTKVISISADDLKSFNSILNHEIQHAIQYIEGFAKGGNPTMFKDSVEYVMSDLNQAVGGKLFDAGAIDNNPDSIFNALNQKTTYGTLLRDNDSNLQHVAEKYGYDNIFDLVEDIPNIKSAYQKYNSLAGEVEARNVQKRMGLSAEERRNSLAEETEDTPRSEQNILFSLKDPNKTMFGMHNISVDKLRKAIKQGGFAAPSMGVVDSKNGVYSDYGEITLIPKAEKLDKRKGKNAGTFTADAWTPTYPRVIMQQTKDGKSKLHDDTLLNGNIPEELGKKLLNKWENYIEYGTVLPNVFAWQYLHEKGMNPKVTYFKNAYPKNISNKVMKITDNGIKRMKELTKEENGELIKLYNSYLEKKGEGLDENAVKEIISYLEEWKDKEKAEVFKENIQRKIDYFKEYGGDISKAQDWAWKEVVPSAKVEGKVNEDMTLYNATQKVDGNKKLQVDFNKWLEGKLNDYGVEEYLYNGETASGKPKYVPNTMENAVKIMKKHGLTGGYNDFAPGVGAFIAKYAPNANTLAAMKKSKDKLIPFGDERHNDVRDEISKEYHELATSLMLNPNGTWSDSGEMRMQELSDVKPKDLKKYIADNWDKEVSDGWVERYNDLVDTIKNDYPVYYFETKFMRPYGLDEFEKAIVPKDTPKDVMDVLKKSGIDVHTYDGKEDREKVTMDAINDRDDIMFSLRGSTSHEEQLAEWKKRNHLPEQSEPLSKPVREEGESVAEFANRMVHYVKNQNLWKTAPKPTGYKDALEKWKKDNGLEGMYPPVHPNRNDFESADEYNMAVKRYRTEKEVWKDAPKPKDFDLSIDVEDMSKQMRNIRRSMLNQKDYDKRTVKAVSDLVNTMLNIGWGDGLSRGKVERLLSAAKNATGANDVKKHIDNVIGILADNYLSRISKAYDNLINTNGVKADQSGVIKIGSLDVNGQNFLSEYKRAMNMDEESINERIANLEDDSAKNPDNATANSYRLSGIQAAVMFKQQIVGNDADIADVTKQIKELTDKKNPSKADKELRDALKGWILENKLNRVQMYSSLLGNVQAMISDSKTMAKEFKRKTDERKNDILHRANLDMEGEDSTYYDTDSFSKRARNNSLLRAVMSPTYTFEQFLKFFGKHHANGEGYLYNYFMGEWHDAVDENQVYDEMNRENLDKKAKELFGKKFLRLVGIDGKNMKEMDCEVADPSNKETGKRAIHLKQGQMLYIYLVNKETDGQMKLRAMGITESDVAAIENNLDPKMKAIGEWLQDEYLPECQRRYQGTHTKYFGAPMKEVDNYFPLVINNRARNIREDVNQDTDAMSQLAGTFTGAIVTRRVNTVPLDIENADAIAVAYEHLKEMEEWSAMLPFRQDINTLLSYTHFRNQVTNQKSVAYGSGNTLWNEFKQTAQIAAGTYKPKVGSLTMDSKISKVLGLVSMAKISGRLWTAIKQSQSALSFITECDPQHFIWNGINPYGSWKWAYENLPLFRKRVDGMIVGDTRIKQFMDSVEKTHDVAKTIAKVGMFSNILFDSVTCAIGARSVYQTELNKLTKRGYPKEKAEEKAMMKASLSYNTTQQSSEGAFVSPLQVDRTYVSAALSLFKNANYAYGRKKIEAVRGLAKTWKYWGEHKNAMVESMKRQIMEEDGLEADVADKIANTVYKRTFYHNLGMLLNYMTIMPISWSLYKVIPYILLGDDDDKKWKMAKDSVLQGLSTTMTDDYAIPFVSSAINAGLEVGDDGKPTFNIDKLKYQNLYINPATSDLANIYSIIGNQKWWAAANKFGMLGMQALIGFNPETVGQWIEAYTEFDGSNGNLSIEAKLAFLKAINAPEASIRGLYIDELGLDDEDTNKVSLAELEKRYAERQMNRDFGISKNFMSKETYDAYVEKYKKSFEKKIQEKMDKIDSYDKKRADGIFNTTSDADIKKMIDKKRTNDASGTDEKEGDSESEKKDKEIQAAYDKAKNSFDLAADISISVKNKALRKKFKKKIDEYGKLDDSGKEIYKLDNPDFESYKEYESSYKAYGKEIKTLKEELLGADNKKAASIMVEIRQKREEFIKMQENVN